MSSETHPLDRLCNDRAPTVVAAGVPQPPVYCERTKGHEEPHAHGTTLWSDPHPKPAELDPGMVEKARAAFEAMTKAMLDAGRRYEERMNAATTAALSAAGVPGLVAEVERLRYDLDHSYSQREWSALTARATSAEQERDRLRAAIRALHQPRTYPSPDHSTAMVTYCVGCDEATGGHPCNTLALLAGSGEQAGEASTSVASPEFCKCQKPPHYPHRPAPVVPDGGHVLTEYGTTSCPVEIVRAEVVDGKCSACGAVVPDSPVDWQAHARAQVQAAEGDDTALRQIAASAVPGAVPDSADVRAVTIAALDAVQPTWRATGREPSEDDLAWTRAVLAVVGQGVTAEQAWDEGLKAGEAVERARWQWSAGPTARAVNGLTERPERPANPYRAAVRPTGQPTPTAGDEGGAA